MIKLYIKRGEIFKILYIVSKLKKIVVFIDKGGVYGEILLDLEYSRLLLEQHLPLFLAKAIGLQYAVSAGVITILTIQNTKKKSITFSFPKI